MHVLQRGKMEGIMRCDGSMSSTAWLEDRRFQAYFLARKVRRNYFPHVSTVMWPSPLMKMTHSVQYGLG
jgi:hypothetical protein